MKESLHVLYSDRTVGTLIYDRKQDAISLRYEDAWQFGQDGFPISLSLPLARREHSDAMVRPYLQNLLPDHPAVVEAWGKRFQVSPRNPFDLIKNVGEDCAGAFQFVRQDRLDAMLSGKLDSLTPLSDADLEKRLEDLNAQSRALPIRIEGRFSLAGAQTKDALHWKDGKWHVPGGRIPTTHILKPESDDFAHHALNEHFCLQLAACVGLSRIESRMMEIAGKHVLCVKRYDRETDAQGTVTRWHQEDMCQASGSDPNRKYQSDGGPSAADIVTTLERFSDDRQDDISRFVMALAFNWAIAGTDAHAKNYSLLHAPGGVVRLAPCYDLASWLPYERDPKSTRIKLAMSLGGTYRLHQINRQSWEKWAKEAGLDPTWVKTCVITLLNHLQENLEATTDALLAQHPDPFIQTLGTSIAERTRKCVDLVRESS